MNWMTGGKHRALYSQRGRRRQMHFPSQVQRQRVKPASPPRTSQPERARDAATPWYIVSVGDDDESQDIRVLELERKGAMSSAEIEAERKAEEDGAVRAGGDGSTRTSPTQKRSRPKEQNAQDGKSEGRCIFTPVKKSRKYDQPALGALQRVNSVREERPPSSIASGVDMLFFNDGKEIHRKNRARSLSSKISEPGPASDFHRRYSQHKSDNMDQAAPQKQPPPQNCQLRQKEAQILSDGESFHSIDAFPDITGGANQRNYQSWRVNSNSHTGSSPDTAFSRSEAPSFRNEDDSMHSIQESFQDTPPSSPFTTSPLPFRMSRAEVLQSQLPSKVPDVAGPYEAHVNHFGSPNASPSPSTSTSSQCSIVLGRPPLGWQKKMMSSLTEDRYLTLDQSMSNPSIPPRLPSPAFTFDDSSANGHQLHQFQNQSLQSSLSSRSSSGSDEEASIIDAIVPIDAKERIMAVASQQLPEDSRMWSQQPAITSTELNNVNTTVSTHRAKSTTLQQQSWVMSSRTKTILDAVSASKVSTSQSLVEKRDIKYQEMESVAIYMYTLVQCYKVDESLRTDRPAIEHSQLPQEASDAIVTKPAACRREIIFSPKRN